MDTPAVAGNDLAVGMQGMTVESGTPTKQAPALMSMWEGIRAALVLNGPGQPGDIVIMTVNSNTRIEVALAEPVSVWGHLGRILHHSKGESGLKNYTVAVVAICNSDSSTHTKLLRVARSAFDIVAQQEIVIAVGTILGGGEPAAGPACGQQAPREY